MSWIRGLSSERADELERMFGDVVGEMKKCMADPDVPDIHVGNIKTETRETQGERGFS